MKNFPPYFHKVQYYETDKMGIVHHSNYLRWFEEARTEYLESAGMGYDIMEKNSIIIPVLKASCQYKISVEYGNTVAVIMKISNYNGIKFSIKYEVYSHDMSVLHAYGETEHCFLDKNFKPVNIKKYNKEAADIFEKSL